MTSATSHKERLIGTRGWLVCGVVNGLDLPCTQDAVVVARESAVDLPAGPVREGWRPRDYPARRLLTRRVTHGMGRGGLSSIGRRHSVPAWPLAARARLAEARCPVRPRSAKPRHDVAAVRV